VPRATKYKIIRSDGTTFETLATTYIDPEWTPAAGLTYTIEAVNRAGHSTDQPAVGAAPRQVWALTNNLPWDGSGMGSMQADPDGDGRINLLEYFHGLNPQAHDLVSPVTFEHVGNAVAFRYRFNPQATDLPAWRVVWKADLSDPLPWSDTDVTDAPDTDPAWRRAVLPLAPGIGSCFLRLEVDEP